MTRSATINVMVQAARKAARHLARDFGEVEQLQVSRKGPADFVSAADQRAEDTIHYTLEKARPGYSFLMEERGAIAGSDRSHRWIIDPLDGTTNFLHGIPLYSISIALERDGKLVAALVYCPILDELFSAERGRGAFLNDRRIRVAARQDLGTSVICCGIPHLGRGDHEQFSGELAAVMPLVAGVRRTGSAALDLAWLAAGRFDGFFERGLAPWDIAAGMLLVREAGGMFTDFTGRPTEPDNGDVVAANDALHSQLLSVLKGPAVPSS